MLLLSHALSGLAYLLLLSLLTSCSLESHVKFSMEDIGVIRWLGLILHLHEDDDQAGNVLEVRSLVVSLLAWSELWWCAPAPLLVVSHIRGTWWPFMVVVMRAKEL